MQVIVLKKFPSQYENSIFLSVENGKYIYNIEKDLLYKINLDTVSKVTISDAYKKAEHNFQYVDKESLNVCIFELESAFFIVDKKEAIYIDLNNLDKIVSGTINTVLENNAENPTAFLNNDIKSGLKYPTDYQTIKIKCWLKDHEKGEK